MVGVQYTLQKINLKTLMDKFSTISHYLMKLFATQSFAISSSVTYSAILPNFANSGYYYYSLFTANTAYLQFFRFLINTVQILPIAYNT